MNANLPTATGENNPDLWLVNDKMLYLGRPGGFGMTKRS
jgi:hypothetical protein